VVPADFDWKEPDHGAILRDRLVRLKRLREHRESIPLMRAHYRAHPADFIDDWGMTYDPRLVDQGLPGMIPFLLFQKQRDFVDEVLRHWRERRPLIAEKSRDCGLSWVAIALSCTLCLHHESLSIGFGSRLTDYVDKIDEPKSLFWKARAFMENLPAEFRGGWEGWRDAPHMRINFPGTGSYMGGEGGDQIGRGDRRSIYFVDESAHLERPKLIDASLAATTNCRIDISSVNGMANPFAEKRWSGRIDVFVFDWRDDPRKDEEWYKQQQNDLDPVTLAQEVDRDYSASQEGIVIPAAWAKAAIDAHLRLGIEPTGLKMVALDIADRGLDKNAACCAHGVVVERVEEWSGKGSDIFATVERAFQICDEYGATILRADIDGIGAGARGDARIINERRMRNGQRQIRFEGFRGSEAVFLPDGQDVKGRKNKDYFQNRKAQGWWGLRARFQNTHRWIVDGVPCDPDDIISLSSKIPGLMKVIAELSQPTHHPQAATGKMVIDKSPDSVKSPDKADSIMIRFAAIARAIVVPEAAMVRAMMPRMAAAGGYRRKHRF
jgi:phage terminase large subunit